jgi:hypothetical protein
MFFSDLHFGRVLNSNRLRQLLEKSCMKAHANQHPEQERRKT